MPEINNLPDWNISWPFIITLKIWLFTNSSLLQVPLASSSLASSKRSTALRPGTSSTSPTTPTSYPKCSRWSLWSSNALDMRWTPPQLAASRTDSVKHQVNTTFPNIVVLSNFLDLYQVLETIFLCLTNPDFSSDADFREKYLGEYLCDSALVHGERFLKYKPSMLCAASLCLARATLRPTAPHWVRFTFFVLLLMISS